MLTWDNWAHGFLEVLLEEEQLIRKLGNAYFALATP